MLVKTKRLLPLLLALILIASPVKANGQSLIDLEQLQDQSASFDTTPVRVGSFINEYNAPALVHYPLQQDLKVEKNGAIFVEFVVEEGENVSKGDVLARFTIETSNAELERLKREISRLEEETRIGVLQRQEAIKVLQNSDAEGLEKEKNGILLKKANAELAYYQYLQQRSLDALKQQEKTELQKQNGYTLLAPADGLVTDFAEIQNGEPVSMQQTLMTFIRTDVVQLRISNSSGDLRYNMPVKITVGRQNKTTVLEGRVVAADGLIPAEKQTGYAYICVETDAELTDPKITAEVMRLDNVMIVERGAVIAQGGKHYVTKSKDEMLQKRYVGFGTNNTGEAWIIYGVAEGDMLIAG